MQKKVNISKDFLTQRPEDPAFTRLASCVESFSDVKKSLEAFQKNSALFLWGFADDHGVKANKGRFGAAKGPRYLRDSFYKLPAPKKDKDLKIFDLGDFLSAGKSLEGLHQEARVTLKALHAYNLKSISFGGGHDWAAVDGDYEGVCVVHLDTHLDVRPLLKKNKVHSGMPFRYLAEKGAKIYCLGAQPEHNASHHWEWAEKNFTKLWSLKEIQQNERQVLSQLKKLLSNEEKIFLSIDLDTFPQSISPGVSAPSPRGLSIDFVSTLMNDLAPQIRHLGLYELNPRFDRDLQSARLGAYLAYQFYTALLK